MLCFYIGPNSGLGHNSVVFMAECQFTYIIEAMKYAAHYKFQTITLRDKVQRKYNRELQNDLSKTVWTTGGCKSWYADNTGKNTTLWPTFTVAYYFDTCNFDEQNYNYEKKKLQ